MDTSRRSLPPASWRLSFHSYLLKYTDMIQRGHLPTYKGNASNDTVYFLRQFLRPGDEPVRANLQAACRTLHLAFPHQSFDEVYNILTGLLIKVVNTYDPHYTDKVKLVVEAINRLPDSGCCHSRPGTESSLRPETLPALDVP